MDNIYIGISNDRLKHILGVARKCYELAKLEGHTEEFCRRMWVIGWNHDIGYEFSKIQLEHPVISGELLYSLLSIHDIILNDTLNSSSSSLSGGYNSAITAIKMHGNNSFEQLNNIPELRILNMADMLINSKGVEVTVYERLNDIKERYGEQSEQYLNAYDLCNKLGMIDEFWGGVGNG